MKDEVMQQLYKRLDGFDKKFDIIDGKLDSVGKALISLARTEERVTIILEQSAKTQERLDVLSTRNEVLNDKINSLETRAATQGQSLGVFERLGWVVITTCAGLIAFFVKK